MRKFMLWILLALLALSGAACAEEAANTYVQNGFSAARTDYEVYMPIAAASGEMLLRVPVDGGQPVCVDRADSFADLMHTESGVVYLKTTNGSSAIMRVKGNIAETIYSFGADSAQKLTISDGKFLVLMDGRLHSIEEGTGTCLKLSGAQMLDYVAAEEYVYYIAGSDMINYTVQQEDGTSVSAQAGCIYKLNLKNGNTSLLLKSGAEELHIAGNYLYFYNMADAYARDGALRGNLYSFNLRSEALEAQSREAVSDFYPLQDALVAGYAGRLNRISGGAVSLYAPEAGAEVAYDGNVVYVWEPVQQKLTQVNPGGLLVNIFEGALQDAVDAALLPAETPAPEATDAPVSGGDISDWFDAPGSSSSAGGSSGGQTAPNPTPIGQTAKPTAAPTAKPAATAKPTAKPTARPTAKPTSKPTAKPTAASTAKPSGTSSSYIFPHSNTRKLTEAEILNLDRSLWSYARNEIYARHGYVFSSSSYAKYFGNKTWYTPGGFSRGDLNSIEWYNMDLIKEMEDKYPKGATAKPTAAPEITPEPQATEAPETTAAPQITEAPEAVPAPTSAPTTEPAPEATAAPTPKVTESPIPEFEEAPAGDATDAPEETSNN